MLEDSEADLCCIPSQQQIKITLVVCDVFTFRGGLFTFSGLDLYIFFRSLFAHINAYISNQVAQLNQSLCPPKFIWSS